MLKRINHLTKNSDFSRVFRGGRSAANQYLVVRYIKSGQAESRFGFVVGLKASKKATERNLIKRRMREIIRVHKDEFESGYDVVVAARKAALDLKSGDLKTILLSLLSPLKKK